MNNFQAKNQILDEEALKNLTCTICNKTFTRKDNLKAHQKKHSDIKPFSCTICHQSFSVKRNWSRHMVKCSKNYKTDLVDINLNRQIICSLGETGTVEMPNQILKIAQALETLSVKV